MKAVLSVLGLLGFLWLVMQGNVPRWPVWTCRQLDLVERGPAPCARELSQVIASLTW